MPENRVDPGGKQWVTDYNPAGELVSETDPLLRSTGYTYDGAGRTRTISDPSGRLRTNFWQTDGLLDYWTASDGGSTMTVDFGYDPVGRRNTASLDGTPLKTYAYNAAGDLTAESTSFMGMGARTPPTATTWPDGATSSVGWMAPVCRTCTTLPVGSTS